MRVPSGPGEKNVDGGRRGDDPDAPVGPLTQPAMLSRMIG
jgi:hypothetical protein